MKNYCRGLKLLIHEATLQDGMEEDAASKMHATTSQAINFGQECGIWRTILTHFSPRYQKIAETLPIHLESKTMIAFDHTRLSFSQMEWAYQLIAIYQEMIFNERTDGSANVDPDKEDKKPQAATNKPSKK